MGCDAADPGTAPTFANTLGGGESNFQRSHAPAPFTSPHRLVFCTLKTTSRWSSPRLSLALPKITHR